MITVKNSTTFKLRRRLVSRILEGALDWLRRTEIFSSIFSDTSLSCLQLSRHILTSRMFVMIAIGKCDGLLD